MSSGDAPLTTDDHDRGAAGLRWVYPVISRRSGGCSVGVNLNPNQACNWRCVYCQVPNLSRGAGPPVELDELRAELSQLLGDIVHGDFLARRAPAGARLTDVAFSGDGEPTTSAHFEQAIEVVRAVLDQLGLAGELPLLLITNGSLIGRESVDRGLRQLAAANGRVWFKLDRGTDAGIAAWNDTRTSAADSLERLCACAQLAPTWVQTCMAALDGQPPPEDELEAWLGLLRSALERGAPLRGVLLYGLARPSLQPEAARLSALPAAWLEALGERVSALGLDTKVSP